MDDSSSSFSSRTLIAFSQMVREWHTGLTSLDQWAGDGDFGDNLRRGLDRSVASFNERGGSGFDAMSRVFLDEVGGTSGPLFGLLFRALYGAEQSGADPRGMVLSGTCGGMAAIQRIGGAEVGDRTMVDALAPGVLVLEEGGSLADAAAASWAGAESTAGTTARHGRASYVGERALGAPDPGAVGIAMLYSAFANADSPGSASTEFASLMRVFRD